MEAPPPSYASVSDTKCTFVDFIPECLAEGFLGSKPKYEKFNVLFARANQWLRTHPGWKVISCESVESKLKDYEPADTNKSTYRAHREYDTNYTRSLRLWICNKTPADNPQPQKISYWNVVPKCTNEGGIFDRPEFERFGTTIANLNSQLERQPIEGRIINMETQNMKFKDWDGTIHADKCIWRESGKHNVYFLNMIRIFYEVGEGVISKIGTADFVPNQTGEYYASFGSTMAKANNWIAQQPADLNICNVQSIDYKVAGGYAGGEIDTYKSLYCEHGERNTKYARIIRVYWTCGSEAAKAPRGDPLLVTYRTFMPYQLSSGWEGGSFETQKQSAKRMLAWINATGAKVMSCETIRVRHQDSRQGGDPEVTYVSNSGRENNYFILALRLYLDGSYRDPPPGVLPPRPQMEEEECCTIL